MGIDQRRYLTFLLAAAITGAFSPALGAERRQHAPEVALSVAPGTLIRWSVPGTKRCSIGRRSWVPLGDTCYFPIDLEQRPGVISVVRRGASRSEAARIRIEPRSYGTQSIELPDIPQGNPSAEDLRRNERDRVFLAKVFHRSEGPPLFSLPLGKPANPLPEGKSFGVERIFNGKPAMQPHMGSDYPVPVNAPVLAVADGTVVLAQDLFYPGNAVFIDHGDGLISMYFHLSEIDVGPGEEVRKGDRLGRVGTTGRST